MKSKIMPLALAVMLLLCGCSIKTETSSSDKEFSEQTPLASVPETSDSVSETTISNNENTVVITVPVTTTTTATTTPAPVTTVPVTTTVVTTTTPAPVTTTPVQTVDVNGEWTETPISRDMYMATTCYARKKALMGSEKGEVYFFDQDLRVVAITNTGYYKLESGEFMHSDYMRERIAEVTTVTTTASKPVEENPQVITPVTTTIIPNASGIAPQRYTLTSSDEAFLDKCCFVGDSICDSIFNCGYVGLKGIVAQPCIGARNIYEYEFKHTDKNYYGIIQSVKLRNPEYVIFWMGMNDVNLVEADVHAKNYEALLKDVKKAVPAAKLIVLSQSPITVDSRFSHNERIDDFNSKLKAMIKKHSADGWQYVDISYALKDSTNSLRPEYNSGDGIHLNVAGVDIVVKAACLGVER